jgi:WD40 repeat protein
MSKSILKLHARASLSDYVTTIAWSPVSPCLAAGSGCGEVLLMQGEKRIFLRQPSQQSIDAIGFSGNGQYLAASGQEGTVSLWQVGAAPQLIDVLEGDKTWVDRLIWHPSRNYLAFNQNKSIQIWNVDEAELVTDLEMAGQVQDMRWSPDGEYLAIAEKNSIYISPIQRLHEPVYHWELPAPGMALAWSFDGTYLAAANQNCTVSVLDWTKLQHLKREPIHEDEMPLLLRGFPGKVRRLAWSSLPSSLDLPPLLAAATRDLVTLWMPDAGDWQNWILDLHSGTVLDMAFQPRSGFLASLSEDGWIILWEAALEPAQILEEVVDKFSCLAWHRQGKYLAAGGQQGELMVWSVNP